MKAILIETDKNTVREVEFDGSLDHAYRLLGIDQGSRLVQEVYLRNCGIRDTGGVVLVDEEGRLRNETRALGAFAIGCFPQLLMGRGLVVGVKRTGDGNSWCAADIDISVIRSATQFNSFEWQWGEDTH